MQEADATPDVERSRAIRGWLEEVLGSGDFELHPASEDASFRRYLRVTHRGDTRVLMDAPPAQEDCRPYLRVARMLRDAGLHAPRVDAADVERGLVLLEDLGDTPYLDALAREDPGLLYADATAALLRMQAIPPADLPAYDESLLRVELELFTRWFLPRHLEIELEPGQARVVEDAFAMLLRACLEQPAVFVHRDYHSRNLMRLARDNPGIIDFQDAVCGPIAYDLVSLFRDVYVRWPPERVAAWVDDHHAATAAAGLCPGVDAATFRRWFDLTGAQRHLKVAGIFARLWYRDGKSRYLADIPLCVSYLRETCAARPELHALGRLLDDLRVTERLAARNRAVLGGAPE